MPFKSKKQSDACFASKGFGGKVDCEEWAKKTNYKKLPKKKFKEWMEEREFLENKSFSEMVSESVAPTTRYSIEVNFRTDPKETLNAFAKICLGYVSAAMKQRDYRVKAVFTKEPYRIIISSRNWDDGEWTGMVYFLPEHEHGTFMIAKGFYNHKSQTISIQTRKKCDGDSAAEITKELVNMMHDLKNKPDRHADKLKPVLLKRGPKR